MRTCQVHPMSGRHSPGGDVHHDESVRHIPHGPIHFALPSQTTPRRPLKRQREVDRAMGNVPDAFIVVDVTTRTVPAAHRMDLASSHLEAPGSTLKPFRLVAL